MKFFSASMVVAAVLASSALVSASSPENHKLVRRASHKTTSHKCTKSCSTSSSTKRKHSSTSTRKPKTTSTKKHSSSSSKKHSTSSSKKHSTSSTKKHSTTSTKKSSSTSKKHSTSSTKKSTATSTKSSPTSVSSHGVNKSGGKMGLDWANADRLPIENFDFGAVSWFYSWNTVPGWDAAPVDELMYCPMLWGTKMTDEFQRNVLDNQNSKFNVHKCAMGMNEVNQQDQSIMSPSDGCDLMEQYLMPLKDKDWYIIGPSTSSAPSGKVWYQDFQKKCPDVFKKLDSIAVHYYGTSADAFVRYLQDWHTVFGKDIWVTEFACQNYSGGAQCTPEETTAFAKQMATFMNAQDWIKGWAPFAVLPNIGISETQRLNNGSTPTDLFRTYARSD